MPDRALLLGHTVQVNESHYSVSDKRRLDKIKETLRKREVIFFPFLCLSVPERATCEHRNTATHKIFACNRLNVHEGIRTSDPTLRSEF